MNIHLSFHTILILAYTIPNVYVFLRIGQLFIDRRYRFRYFVIYFLPATIYPAANLLSEYGQVSSALSFISGYLLPFYLYLFLALLVFDLFLLFNRVFKIIPRVKLWSSKFRRSCLASIILLPAAIVTAGVINFNTIRTSEYRIDVLARSSGLKHLRIAFAADFHLTERTNIRFVRRFAEKIREINPDLMVYGGDIVEGDREDEITAEAANILGTIHPRYGAFAVLGNHEFYSGQDKGSFFGKAGMTVLCDTVVIIDNSFSLAGRYDSHFSDRKPVASLLKAAADSLPLILADHRPTEIDQVSSTMADVQLSGHTHNGQLFPINLITRSVYRLSWGHMKAGKTHFFVTSGIRLWGPPVRTAGKSEIIVIDITFTRDPQ
jgi:uncharacterized protein